MSVSRRYCVGIMSVFCAVPAIAVGEWGQAVVGGGALSGIIWRTLAGAGRLATPSSLPMLIFALVTIATGVFLSVSLVRSAQSQ